MTIRRLPTDFIVEELLTPAAIDSIRPEWPAQRPVAHFAVYTLTKTSLTTPEGVHWLAQSLGVRDGLVTPAGLKDKHAQTSQHVSVRVADTARKPEWPEAPSGDNGRGWSARFLGWADQPLAADAIAANRFTIVVRDISRPASDEIDRRAELLRNPSLPSSPGRPGSPNRDSSLSPDSPSLSIVNYFGDQRFGSARHGKGWIASHLVRGEFEEALRLAIASPARKETGDRRAFTRLAAAKWGKWEELARELPRCPERRAVEALAAHKSFRDAFALLTPFFQQICVEAFQSHIWNEMVRRYVAPLCGAPSFPQRHTGSRSSSPATPRPDDPWVIADDSFGDMVFPSAQYVREASANDAVRSAPMLAPESTPPEPWASLAAEVLAEFNLTIGDLRIPGLRRPVFGEVQRPVFVEAEGFQASPPEPDELSAPRPRFKRTLHFDLPRGAYATVVLRALGQ